MIFKSLKLNMGKGGDGGTERQGAQVQLGTGEQCRGPVDDGGSSKVLRPDDEQGRKNVLSVWYTAQC